MPMTNNVQIPDRILQRLNAGQEIRRMVQPMEAREGGEAEMIVEGYACTFNEPYELGRYDNYVFTEEIDARAFDECDMSDVIMQFDHEGRVFARNRNHTLDLSADAHGLKTIGRLGGTELGRSVYQDVKGGYLDKMSFRFRVGEDERKVTENHETGVVTISRRITKISKLYDVSIVSIPANDATEIFARSMAAGVSSWAQQELLAVEQRRAMESRIRIKIQLMNMED